MLGNSAAQSRFKNDQQRAAQASLVQQVHSRGSLAGENLPGVAVNKYNRNRLNPNSYKPNEIASLFNNLAQKNIPHQMFGAFKPYQDSGGTDFDLETLKNDIEIDRFLNSPELDEAVTRTKLTEYFQSQNTG